MLALAVASLTSGCLPQFAYSKSAPPVEKTVTLIESDPRVAQALGDSPSVSLWATKEFKRDFFKASLDGRDQIHLLTKVTGSKGEAWLDLDATNIDKQGWSGTFSVRGVGKQVLEGGSYVEKGAGLILEGNFHADGSPSVTGPN